jgi:hypothetical protein
MLNRLANGNPNVPLRESWHTAGRVSVVEPDIYRIYSIYNTHAHTAYAHSQV